MAFETPKTLTIDNQEYDVSSFSEQVQQLVFIHTKWRNDLQDEKLAVAKTEAAIRSADVELANLVKTELEARAEKAE